MKRQLIAGAAALALVLSGLTVVPAEAKGKNNDALKLLLGAAAVGILLNQMNAAQGATPQGFLTQRPRHSPDIWSGDDEDNRWNGYGHAIRAGTVPGECLTDMRMDGRLREVVSGRCLNQFGLAGSLPDECAFDVRTSYGRRTVYGPQCLRDYGYRIDRARY